MRVETSVTQDERVLKAIDKATTRTRSRSRLAPARVRAFDQALRVASESG